MIEDAASAVERATKTDSRQPRLTGNTDQGFSSVLNFLRIAEIEMPAYVADSRRRDAWTRSVWRLEPHLAGVVNTVVLIDSNRGWELTGGRNQVNRYSNTLHDADGGEGWRTYSRKSSLSYWATDIGMISEVGRDGRGGPLRSIYHVDSARCRLTGNADVPLEYNPAVGGKVQQWPADAYFRVASMPSDDEALRGLGFCAISRCIETLRLLYAVMLHDQEQVAARAPKGLLLLQGISEDQWNSSLQAREANLDSLERVYYGGVQVLATAGMDQVDAKLVALSNLPQNFDAKTFIDLSMYAYALAFGYDPSEFWPVQFGALGRGNEAEMQHRKATGKGGLEFALGMQEQLQLELPPTLLFEFEQRDEAAEVVRAETQIAKTNVVKAMYETGLMQGAPMISREEARQLLAQAGLIPEEWAIGEQDVSATDTDDLEAERYFDTVRERPALGEPVMRYRWPQNAMRMIYDPRKRTRQVAVVKRQEAEPLYEGSGFTITEEDVDRAIEKARRRAGEEIAELLVAPTLPEPEAA